jgi:hypothetical protein
MEENAKQAFLTFNKVGEWPQAVIEIDPTRFRESSAQAHGLLARLRTGPGHTSWDLDQAICPETKIIKGAIQLGEPVLLEVGMQIIPLTAINR